MHLLSCDLIYVVIPGQCFIYDHANIFRVVLLYEYVAMKSVLFVFLVMLSTLHFWGWNCHVSSHLANLSRSC